MTRQEAPKKLFFHIALISSKIPKLFWKTSISIWTYCTNYIVVSQAPYSIAPPCKLCWFGVLGHPSIYFSFTFSFCKSFGFTASVTKCYTVSTWKSPRWWQHAVFAFSSTKMQVIGLASTQIYPSKILAGLFLSPPYMVLPAHRWFSAGKYQYMRKTLECTTHLHPAAIFCSEKTLISYNQLKKKVVYLGWWSWLDLTSLLPYPQAT